MMAKKVEIFNDIDMVSRILDAPTPAEAKNLGRRVSNFDPVKWDIYKVDVVFNSNMYKFSQNKELNKYLLSTEDAILVEASPYDKVWGIGISNDVAKKNNNPGIWKGDNLLGFTFMDVREKLKDK